MYIVAAVNKKWKKIRAISALRCTYYSKWRIKIKAFYIINIISIHLSLLSFFLGFFLYSSLLQFVPVSNKKTISKSIICSVCVCSGIPAYLPMISVPISALLVLLVLMLWKCVNMQKREKNDPEHIADAVVAALFCFILTWYFVAYQHFCWHANLCMVKFRRHLKMSEHEFFGFTMRTILKLILDVDKPFRCSMCTDCVRLYI